MGYIRKLSFDYLEKKVGLWGKFKIKRFRTRGYLIGTKHEELTVFPALSFSGFEKI